MPDRPSSPTAPPRAIFLSYSHDDAAAARRIAETLRAAGIEVWFDEKELRGGDAWDQKIRQQIRDCALFLPIVSQNTQRRREGYFRLEWHLAEERSRLIARGTPFLVPVAVDDVPERTALVPEVFLSVQWTRLRDGEAPAAFGARLRQLLAGETEGVVGPARTIAADANATREAPVGTGRRWLFPVGAVAVAVVAVALYLERREATPAATGEARPAATKVVANLPAAPSNEKSIAVLPFANLSPDKDNEFFADGVHADLLSALTGLRELKPISSQSVSGFRGTTKKIQEIARELGVNYVLTGSMRRAGNDVRLSVQLIDARTDTPIWSPAPYTRKMAAIFELQSELAQAIAGELKAVLSPEEKRRLERRPTENLAAYDLYLKAKEADYWAYNDPVQNRESLRRREALLQSAVALDSKFVLAWAELSGVHLNFVASKHDTTSARKTQAKQALDYALQLDPEAPAAIRMLARYTNFVLRDWQGARREVERLLRLAPNDATAISLLGQFQINEGQFAEALSNFQQAVRLDPLNAEYVGNQSYWFWRGRRFGAAAESMRREFALRPAMGLRSALARLAFQATGSVRETEELAAQLAEEDPRAPEVLRLRLLAAIWRGDLAEAVRLDQARPSDPDARPGNAPGFVNGDGTGDMALIYLQRGDVAAARRRLGNFPELLRADLLREPENTRVQRYLGTLEAILGRKEEALRHAERSVGLANSPGVRANAREVLAQVCAIVGEKDRALAELAELLRLPSQVNVNELKVMPVYFNLRGDPRFEALVKDPKNQAPLF
jgi:TolB-like protein/Flp pilus assembly protein TadD